MTETKSKCFYCAELIKTEAARCRYCGQEITSANRVGLPNWYVNTGACGLTLFAIQMDLEEAAFSGETGNLRDLDGSVLVRSAYDATGDPDEYRILNDFGEFIDSRMTKVWDNPSQIIERSFLLLLRLYYHKVATLTKNSSHWNVGNLNAIQTSLREAKQHLALDNLPSSLRQEFIALFSASIEEIERVKRRF